MKKYSAEICFLLTANCRPFGHVYNNVEARKQGLWPVGCQAFAEIEHIF